MAEGVIGAWCKFAIVFTYNLAFGIKFLTSFGKTDAKTCGDPAYSIAQWVGIYFTYSAAFNLLELIIALTVSMERVKSNRLFKAIFILLELPTHCYALAYLGILYGYGKADECPYIESAIHSWIVFAFVLTFIAVACAFIILTAYILSFQGVRDYFNGMETTLLGALGTSTQARKIYIWCTFILSFTYHLIFGILFLTKVADTDPEICKDSIYDYSKIAGAYFIYMALYSLGDLICELTNLKAKLSDRILGRVFGAIVLIPVSLTPLIYLKLLALSGFDTCPGAHDAVFSFFMFNCICSALYVAGKVFESLSNIFKSEEEVLLDESKSFGIVNGSAPGAQYQYV